MNNKKVVTCAVIAVILILLGWLEYSQLKNIAALKVQLAAERARLDSVLAADKNRDKRINDAASEFRRFVDEVHEMDDFDPVRLQGLIGLGEKPEQFVGNRSGLTAKEAEEFNDAGHTIKEPRTDCWHGEATVDRETLRMAMFNITFEPDEEEDADRIYAKVLKEMRMAFGAMAVTDHGTNGVCTVKQPDGDVFAYAAEKRFDDEYKCWNVHYTGRSEKLMAAVEAREATEASDKETCTPSK